MPFWLRGTYCSVAHVHTHGPAYSIQGDMDLNLEQDIYPTLHADVVVELQRLFEHPRNALIHASPSGGYSKLVPGKAHPVPYRGITRVFDAYFFNTDHVFKNTGGKKPRIVLGDMAPPPPQAPGSVGQALRGRLRGTLVHHHLHDLLTLDELRFKRQWKNEPAHPWALSVVEELLRRGWRPLVGEFVVYDDALQLATAIDLIAVRLRRCREAPCGMCRVCVCVCVC